MLGEALAPRSHGLTRYPHGVRYLPVVEPIGRTQHNLGALRLATGDLAQSDQALRIIALLGGSTFCFRQCFGADAHGGMGNLPHDWPSGIMMTGFRNRSRWPPVFAIPYLNPFAQHSDKGSGTQRSYKRDREPATALVRRRNHKWGKCGRVTGFKLIRNRTTSNEGN